MKTNSNPPGQLSPLAVGLMLSMVTPLAAAVVEQAVPTADAPANKDEISATGTVFSVEPEILSVVMKDNPAPVRFSYSKTTPFLDEKGESVPLDLVRAELPLTVYYEMEGEQMVARRVIMTRSMVAGDAHEKADQKRQQLAGEKAAEAGRAAAIEPLLPKEITGSVSTIEQTITLVARGDTTPTTCVINNSTRYVNVSGQPVSTRWLIPGMPISVKTVRDGKRLIASEIVVRGNTADLAAKNGSATESGNGTARDRTRSGDNLGGSGSIIDPLADPGYVIPQQVLPPTVSPTTPGVPSAGKNPVAPGNTPSQSTPPGRQPQAPGTPSQPDRQQPDIKQPDVKQPAVPPAGGQSTSPGTTSPARPGSPAPASPPSSPGSRP